MRVAQRGVLLREDADVAADRDRVGLDREARDAPHGARREDVVEQHGVETSAARGPRTGGRRRRTRRGGCPCSRSRRSEEVVRDRAAERPDATAPKSASVRKRPASAARTVSTSRNSKYGSVTAERRAPRRRVFDARESDVEVAARDGLVDRLEGDLDELAASRPRPFASALGDLHVEAAHASRDPRGPPRRTARRPPRRRPSGASGVRGPAARSGAGREQGARDERPASRREAPEPLPHLHRPEAARQVPRVRLLAPDEEDEPSSRARTRRGRHRSRTGDSPPRAGPGAAGRGPRASAGPRRRRPRASRRP